MKKRIIAFLCVLSMCMTSIMPVAAQGNEEALDKVPVINSLSVVTEPENGRDSMTGEDELCLEMNVSAPEGIVIQGIDLDYSIEEEHGISFELFEFFFNEEEIAPGKESADFSLTIAPGKYAISGKYFLEAIYIYYGDDWDRLTYYWDDEEDAFVAEEDDFSVIVDCDKDFDFTVLPHEFEDKADPELVSLKWAESVDEENINIMTELELEIECKDDKSGINYVVVEFEDETGEYTEDFTYSREDSEEAVLDGVITLRNSMRRAGTYRLSYIEIEDVLGRVTIYEPEYDATGKLIAMDGKEDAVSAYFYKVAKNNLQVKSVTVEEKEYAAGEDVKGYLTIYNPLNKEAVFNSDEWDIVYETEYNGETLTSRMKSVLEDEDIKIQPKSTYVLELENNLSIYTYPGERKLTEISYVNWEDESISYSYAYDDNGKMVLSDGEEVVDSFDYEEEANYSVSNSNVDINVPELKELKFCVNSEDGKIYSDTEVYVEASYDDKGSSGIQEIYLDYRSEDDEIECFDFYCEEEGEKTGSGTVKLTSEGRLAGKYELDYVYISDYAGNEYSWAVEYEDGIAVIDGVPVTELFGDELVTTYTVWPTEYKDVKIKHLYVSENAKSLSAGESFEITVVLQNDTDEVKRVYPEDWYIEWEAEEEDGTYYPEVYGSGDAIDIEAKSSKAFSFTMETSPYTHTGERILRKIEYNDNETGDVIIRYDYDAENGILVASDSWGSKIDLEPSLEYDGELDWNITKADKYDETPIILSGVEIKTKDIKAPGTVVFRVSLEDEGPAKLSEIYFDMVDINESRNYISLEPIEGGITKVSDKCYDVTVELYDDIIAGTYRFDYIYMQDEAEMGSHYYVEDVESDVVTDGEAIVEVPKMVIVESECKDTDFDGPILKDVLIPNEAEAGKSLCVKVSIEDESELSRAMIKLYNEERDYSFYVDSEKIEKNADGTYTVYFPIGKYMLSGDFELERIDLQDSSVHYNEETYRYDEEVNGWQPDSEDYDVLPFNKNRIVTIKKTVDVPVVENDGESLEKAIAEAKEGDTIVLIDIDGEENTRTLSKKDLLAAKDKKITLIISQPGEIGEVHIAAKDIPDNIPDKVYVSLEVDGIYYIGIEVEGFEELEDMFYEMYLRITADNVPFTLRIPVSEEYEGKEIKLVGFDDEGRNVNKLIYDNLEEKDGIVDVKFPNGSQDISYSYSDGTYVLLLTAKEGCAHKWETTWSHDENEHWYECEKDCGAKGESAVHEFGWIVDKEATETSTGLKHEECSVCHYKKDPVVIDKVVHVHVMKKTVEKAATCTEDGNQEYYTCTKCNKLFQDEAGTKQITAEETVIKSNGHSYEWILDKEATETETGLKHEECSVCHSKRNENTEIDKIDHVHEMKKTNEKAVTCTEDGNKEYYTCTKCNKLFLDEKGNLETSVEKVVIKAAGHKYEWIVDKEATQETTGLKHEECSVCHIKRSEGTVIDKLPGAGLGADDVYRIMGIDRYQTSFETANALKKQMGVDKFNTVVVTCGTNFADALAGSYLASVKKAPILMAKENAPATLADYIKDNMNSNGVIYILGGTNAVSSKVENAVKKANPNAGIIRLEGATRYETNLLILNEAGVTNQDILVCTGNGFADSLSASALERPILLVNKALSKEQKNYLDSLSGNKIYIIGGPNAVAEKVEKEMKAYGTTERIWGNTRYETSVEVAEKFFDKPSEAVIAYGENFPDGLSGGPLAMSKKAPLILASTRMGSIAADYTNKNSIRKGVVLGGPILISDDVIENIFKSDEVVLWK